jgi:uncharacterized protein YyaL (SSP411 family)/cytochrome c biogenesis protein CcdA
MKEPGFKNTFTKPFFIIFFNLLFLLFHANSDVFAETKYTRQRSEALFHLIDWHDYSPATFKKALKEQKPVLLILSAPAWCYWCHVYESEDYLYHPDLYPFINENFIAIFIDSDKRPGLTRKYLEGGWPSTTILAPDLRRISGFSGPRDPEILRGYFEQVVNYLKDITFTEFDDVFSYQKTEPIIPKAKQIHEFEQGFLSYIIRSFDDIYGGFILGAPSAGGETQKFPAPFTLKYLLEKYDETGNSDFLHIVQKTFNGQFTDIADLDKGYHLYDPVEGGFHRYSTKRDWGSPHYEKMLGDQARFIRLYTHLQKISPEDRVKNTVNDSVSFVLTRLYDDEGGFYTSQDAFLEEEYYGLPKDERERIGRPYIDRTRIMDANSITISTFLYLYEVFGEMLYEEISRKSLNFIMGNMIGSEGAYYYYDYEREKPFLTGQAVSNSWAMLAFLDGYAVLREEDYLRTSVQLAGYSLDTLYDWNSGGFFERNSKDSELYAPYEVIELSKPFQENAVFSYALLRLYLITGDLVYLESGLKTLGYILARPGGPDEMYYVLKASGLVEDNDLIKVYSGNMERINSLLDKGRANFFLNKLLDREYEETPLTDLPRLRDDLTDVRFIILVILAFLAGILSFLSPCTLPVLPAYFAQGSRAGKGEILIHTIFFLLGLATVFSIFGMGATLAGSILRENRFIFTKAAAVVIITFGVLEIFGKGFSGLNIYLKGSHRTPIGSYLFGSVFAIGWSACIGPILASLLLLSATTGTVFKGTFLLFIYALGLGIPLIAISLIFDRIKNRTFWRILQGSGIRISLMKKQFSIHSTHLISGLILIVLGTLIFNDYLYTLNKLTFSTDYVQNVIVKGERLLQDFLIK